MHVKRKQPTNPLTLWQKRCGKVRNVRCVICRRPNHWGGRKIAVLVEHNGLMLKCSVNGTHCETCCVPRNPEDIARELREAEAAVNRVLFGITK